MNIKIASILIALFASVGVVNAQDWLDELPQPEPEVVDIGPSPLDALMERMEAAISEAKDAAAEAKAAASKPVKSFDFDTPKRLEELELAVANLQARKEWTEGEIRTLAKEEAEKVMKATVQTPDGKTREVGATSMQVTVAGYAGTFEVKPGERIIAVNGQPITQRATVQSRVQGVPVQSMMAVTPTVQMQTVPQQRGVVRFWSLPSRSAQCVGGNCPQ